MSEQTVIGTALAIITLILIALVIFDMWLRDSFTLEKREENDNVGND